jgi:signal transduction histidine kinase
MVPGAGREPESEDVMPQKTAGAGKHLRILHLEDDSLDAELVREALLREGVECSISVVATRGEFQRALAAGGVDLVISDYKLPDFQGDEALRLVREKCPDLPFIFVSGSIGEERAIEAVKLGATDYVMKERLPRLGMGVRRAVNEAEGLRRRREAEATLEAEREFLTDVFASVQDGIVVLNDRLEIVRANATVERMFPAQMPLEGRLWSAVRGGEDAGGPCAAQTALRTGKAAQGSRRIRTASGEVEINSFAFPLMERRTGRMTGVILYLRDVTRERALQQQLIQAQKMECIGQLAGGVAHDFNNIIQAVQGFGDLLAASLTEDDPRRMEVGEIRKAAARASALTRQLLAFSRKQVLTTAVLDLNALAQGMGKMLHRLIGGNISLEFGLDSAPLFVLGDAGQIEQVVLNLIVNARDAMPSGGRITVATRRRELSAEEAARQGPDWRAGRFACLSVRDTGTGIPPEVMPRLFEPFFTTKEAGKGTGLGLSTVYGIVQQHNGWVEVASEFGHGAEFTVYLPVQEAPARPDSAAVASAPAPAPAPASDGQILVVEDDPVIAKLLGSALRPGGHTVHMAEGTGEARALFARHGERIRLLVSDVALKDGNGVDLATELRRGNPALHVLMISGYVDDRVRWEEIQAQGFAFLPKPFSLSDLLRIAGGLLA